MRKQTNLTRFGLNAYVFGAIRERFNCFGRRLQWLAASLNARELLLFLVKDTNPRNQQQPLNTQISESAEKYPHPTVGRPGGRPTLPPVDRAVDRVPNRELGHFSRSTGRSTEIFPCARCAHRSTGPVDRLPACAGGRPRRSTAEPVLLLLFSAAVVSFAFRRRLPWRSPRRPLGYPCQLPWQYSLFPTILHLGEDFS